jgi:hypothetical protein
MAKVVVKSLRSKLGGRRETTSVTEKRVRDTEGQVKMLRTLDAGSRTFGGDLQYVFGKNVAKARRENKRAIGTADVVIVKR